MSTEKTGVEASFKSMDTEEFLDIHFNRPIGYVWALFFQRFGVHPNVDHLVHHFRRSGRSDVLLPRHDAHADWYFPLDVGQPL